MRSWLPFTVLVALAGCDLYFGNGDDPPPCAYAGAEEKEPWGLYRDPTTATCISAGGGCDDRCGPCPLEAAALPDMGLCESACTDLPETTCLATAGCYAAYYNDSENDGPPSYGGCWQTAPSGPVGGSCANLGAYECSRHDNCSLHYYSAYDDKATSYGATFARCAAENTSALCAGSDCAPGYHCEEQCHGSGEPGTMSICQGVCVSDDSCLAALCAPGTTCVERCGYDDNGMLVCDPECVPDHQDPGSCTGQVACDALPPACPSGTTAGRSNGCWTGYCIPNSACYPGDPGECSGEVTCITGEPACPAGTTAGLRDGCWTGYCIPSSSCPAPECEMLTSEGACTARSDCTPVYTGTNCTCYPSGCTCETLTYDRCEPGAVPL